eukprot:TRINITY_DN692_c0_g1_i1.p1 TRINITY_DN692_c0_g1~~TRINITY_DN692_c0_g1_i1.p1  ORF type:complete len:278 (-),score=85.36 TRINITY_DN692_c0_g1_i1:139-972(-)
MESNITAKIKRYIVKSCPYGELAELLKDLKKLTPLDLEDKEVQEYIKENLQSHFAPVKAADGTAVILTKHNYDETDGTYIDQSRRVKFRVNYIDQTVTAIEPLDVLLSMNLGNYRTLINDRIGKYLSGYYRDHDSFWNVVAQGNDDQFEINIMYTSKSVNLKNFHSGEWIGQWTITKQGFEGHVRINAHFFEEGNVQLLLDRKFKESFELHGDAEAEANHIVETIIKAENTLHVSLKEMYLNMTDQYFKAMRRVLPVTNTKMDWNIAAHKVVQSLRS